MEISYSAVSNLLSSWCQYEALKYVSFPCQTLFKSFKLLPVMVMGKVRKGILIDFKCEIRLCSAGISNSLSREPFLGVFNAETLYWE